MGLYTVACDSPLLLDVVRPTGWQVAGKPILTRRSPSRPRCEETVDCTVRAAVNRLHGAVTARVDTLSEVLRAVRLTGAVYFSIDGSTPWVVETPPGIVIAPHIGSGVEHGRIPDAAPGSPGVQNSIAIVD